MFERLADFIDIVVFAFILQALASLQLRFATLPEVVLALATLLCGLGLMFAKKWALFGTYIVLMVGLFVYFAQIWYQPIVTGEGKYIVSNILKMGVTVLLLVYIGRYDIERRFA